MFEKDYIQIIKMASELARLLTIAPEVNMEADTSYAVRSGPTSIHYQNIDAQGNSIQNINFTFIAESTNTCLSRLMWIKMDCKFVFTKQVAGLANNYIAPAGVYNHIPNATVGICQLPVHQYMSSGTMVINGVNISTPDSSIIPLCNFNLPVEEERTWFSSSPIMRDYAQNLTTLNSAAYNPFATFYNSAGVEISRNASVELCTITQQDTTTTMDLIWYEPVLLVGANFGPNIERGLIGIQQVQIQYNLSSTNGWWRVMNYQAVGVNTNWNGNLTITSINKPRLYVSYNMPPSDSVAIPPRIYYDYPRLNTFVNDANNSTAVGPLFTVNSGSVSNLSVAVIPSRMYIWIAAQASDKALEPRLATIFPPITNLNIDFGTKNSLLSSAKEIQLFTISSKNGSNASWFEFQNVNSVIGLDFAEDIEQQDFEKVGTTTNSKTISFNYTFKRPTIAGLGIAADIVWKVYTCIQYDGLMKLDTSVGAQSVITLWDAPLTMSDNVNIQSLPRIDYNTYRNKDLAGGNWKKTLLNTAKKVAKYAPEILKFTAGLGIPGLSTAADIASVPAGEIKKLLEGSGASDAMVRRVIKNMKGLNLNGGMGLTGGQIVGGGKYNKYKLVI